MTCIEIWKFVGCFHTQVHHILLDCEKSGNLKVSLMAQAVACLSLWRLNFSPMPVHIGFIVDKVAMGQIFLNMVWFFILPLLHIHSSFADYTILPIDSTIK